MNQAVRELIKQAVAESFSGTVNRLTSEARSAGHRHLHERITYVELQALVRSRLDGLREAGEASDNEDSAADLDAAMRELKTPTVAELRYHWLPLVCAGNSGVRLYYEHFEIVMDVPPPRRAHAR